MSWSVSAQGMPPAVLRELDRQFTHIKCNEPEESIKNSLADVISKAVGAYSADVPVIVNASGSQYNAAGSPGINTISVSVTPMYNFLRD